ncbi:hypothetical protein ABZ807_13045 [Micromonospora sp. NPDC047548]|uniref:hypothetical protein n=1 Tax=Micromonospora sp. NPDC047548 TaxID=3155624 RepID=UPI0033BFF1DB
MNDHGTALGPTHAGRSITLWADTSIIHLLLDGVRLRTVPSRLTLNHLRQLLADGGQPAGPSPIATGPAKPGGPIEVDRLVTANGFIALAGRQHPVGYHLAGRRITARLDHRVLHILDADRTLLRSLPVGAQVHVHSQVRPDIQRSTSAALRAAIATRADDSSDYVRSPQGGRMRADRGRCGCRWVLSDPGWTVAGVRDCTLRDRLRSWKRRQAFFALSC